MGADLLQVRSMLDDDLEEVVRLWREAGVSRPWNDPVTDIAFARRGPHSDVLIGLANGRVAATAMVGEDGHRGWAYYVATSPELQRSGMGKSMMNAAESWLRARGVWKIQLLVRGDNVAAKGFYEKLGYSDTGSICFQKVIAED